MRMILLLVALLAAPLTASAQGLSPVASAADLNEILEGQSCRFASADGAAVGCVTHLLDVGFLTVHFVVHHRDAPADEPILLYDGDAGFDAASIKAEGYAAANRAYDAARLAPVTAHRARARVRSGRVEVYAAGQRVRAPLPSRAHARPNSFAGDPAACTSWRVQSATRLGDAFIVVVLALEHRYVTEGAGHACFVRDGFEALSDEAFPLEERMVLIPLQTGE